jgi:hypothetical protein
LEGGASAPAATDAATPTAIQSTSGSAADSSSSTGNSSSSSDAVPSGAQASVSTAGPMGPGNGTDTTSAASKADPVEAELDGERYIQDLTLAETYGPRVLAGLVRCLQSNTSLISLNVLHNHWEKGPVADVDEIEKAAAVGLEDSPSASASGTAGASAAAAATLDALVEAYTAHSALQTLSGLPIR